MFWGQEVSVKGLGLKAMEGGNGPVFIWIPVPLVYLITS